VIVLASQGFVTLEAGIPLILGANVGTCATALLAAIGKSAAALQAALVHTLFNALGAVAWLPLVGLLAAAARAISPGAEGLEGAAELAADVPRQVANAHLVFNVANTLIALPFTGLLAALARRLAPERPSTAPVLLASIHLDPAFLGTPSLAIDGARREVWRMAEEATRLVREAPRLLHSGSEKEASAVQRMFDNVETLHDAVSSYLSKGLTAERVVAAEQVLEVAHYVRSAAEVVAGNVVEVIRKAQQRGAAPSEATVEVLRDFHLRIAALFEDAVHAVRDHDRSAAQRVIDAKAEIDTFVEKAQQHLLARLGADAPQRALLFRLESTTIEHLKRVYYFAKRIAKLVPA
jgi:phosphate:Na+ symporter